MDRVLHQREAAHISDHHGGSYSAYISAQKTPFFGVKKRVGGVWRHPQPKARPRVRADTPVWSQHTPAATSRSQLVLEPGERWPSASGRPSRCPLPCHPNAVRHAHRYLPSPPVLRLTEVPPPLCGSHGGAPRSIVGACPAHRVLCARERADERRRWEQQRRPQQRNLPCERGRVRPQCPGPAAGSTQVRRLASRAGRWDELTPRPSAKER